MARPLRVGIQLPEVEREVHWPELMALAEAAEAAGADSLYVGDHLLYRGDGRPERAPWEAWSLLAGLAAATRRVEIGPLVTCTAFRPPAVLAKTAQTVDDMSGGRLVLGLGCGWNRVEFEAFGLPFERRVARFEESFEVIRRLLAGERVTYRGELVSVEDAVLLPRPARRIPLMVGSNSPRMLAATLPYVDRWNTWWDGYGNTAAGYATLHAAISEAAERAGRDPGEIERSACVLVLADPESTERAVPPGVVPLAGSTSELAHGLAELAAAGADEAILVLSPINLASVELVGAVLALLDG
jgi:alkanesulfonate monooxygenase SsuD/methylene tetrahydromethanopterin reductase-like flavin-dependent oxidoreductase (luciferase family)